MYERLIEWLFRYHRAAQSAAELLQSASALAALCGIAGHLVVVVNSMTLTLGPAQHKGVPSIEILYPQLVTWWIPESPSAWLLLASLFACGVALKSAATNISQLENWVDGR